MTVISKTIAVAVSGLFAMSAPLAAETISFGDLNTTIEDGASQSFDMNGDGFFDLSFSLDDFGNATVMGLGEMHDNGFTETKIQTVGDSTIVDKLGAGDVIGLDRNDMIALMGGPRMVNDIAMVDNFDGDLAMWGESGVTGFLGFTTTLLDQPFCEPDTICELGQVQTLYGFLEIERGSIILGQFTVSTSPVRIPAGPNLSAVPVPAGFPLLLVGLGALGIAKRRKDRAA